MLLYGARYTDDIHAILMEFLDLCEPKHNPKNTLLWVCPSFPQFLENLQINRIMRLTQCTN